MPAFSLSTYAQNSLTPSPVNEMTEAFASDFRPGIDINLGVGYVNDDTIPYSSLQTAFKKVLAAPHKYKSPLNYGGAEGSPMLRQSIREFYLTNKIGGLSNKELSEHKIIIGANGATSLLEAFAETIKEGLVITSNPFYYIYTEFLERKGFTIKAIDEDKNGIRIDLLKAFLQTADISTISFFYIPTVNNPSCTVLAPNRVKELVTIANELSEQSGKLIPVIFDKAYQELIYGTAPAIPSGLLYNNAGNVFEIGTVSKIVAPALRIGYMIAKDSDFTKVVTQKISDTGFSAPLINQEICSYFLEHFISDQISKVNAGYKRKADFIKSTIEQKLKNWIESFTGGEAGFYFYFTFKDIETHKHSDFFNYLSRTTGKPAIDGKEQKKERLIYIPGEICATGKKAKRQLRISFGFEETAILGKAIDLLAEACTYASQTHNKERT